MSSVDHQYLPLGTVAAPSDWVLPPSLVLLIKTVFARYDGSGAAGAFLPTLTIVSSAGETVGEYPVSASVAAGASEDVSWAPFLRQFAAPSAPAATGTTWAYHGGGFTSRTCAAGLVTILSGDSTGFYTNSTADFAQGSFTDAGHINYGIKVLTTGHYLGLAYITVNGSGGLPPVGSKYRVAPHYSTGDLEEAGFYFGNVTNYAHVVDSDEPFNTLYGNLGTVTAPGTDFQRPWIFQLQNDGTSTLVATVSTLMFKLDSSTTALD